MTANTRRVAVTGLGMVCSLGNNVEECWQTLTKGESRIAPLLDGGTPPYRFSQAAEARHYRPEDFFSDKELLYLERFAQFALASAREAVRQSGLSFQGELADRCAVIMGTGVGGHYSQEEGYYRLYRENNPRVPPLTIPRTMSNSGTSAIALDFGIHGPSYTVSTACSSANHAIGQAFQLVRSGSVTAAITGGSEAVFTQGLLRAWEAMRVVSPDTCRPFSLDRRGLSLGEGGAALVLENWDHALARGATILGVVLGFGMSADAHHITQPSANGPRKAMEWALRDAALAPEQIGHINAHGTGTQANDSTESEAIRAAFGAHADHILVNSTKSMHGHTLGAAGAIEAVATVLTVRHGIIPPTANFTAPDPTCAINIVANQAKTAAIDAALSNTFAFGGLNAVLVFGSGRE
jgi:nodulation protein E